MACLSLGLPATVSHIIDENSPLCNLSIEKMASRRMEVRIHISLFLSYFSLCTISAEHCTAATTGVQLSVLIASAAAQTAGRYTPRPFPAFGCNNWMDLSKAGV